MNERSRKKGKSPGLGIRARNKRKIIRAAVHLFASKGYEGTRLGEIARDCGLPRANLYYYFSSKEGIYAALIEQVLEGWDRAFEHIRSDRTPRAAIRAYVRAKLEYSRTHSVESRFFANEILSGAEFLTQEHRHHMRKVTDQRADVIRGWIDEGSLAPVDPYHFFILLWSATQFYADFGLLAADIMGREKLTAGDFDLASETISRIVLDGCCQTTPQESPDG